MPHLPHARMTARHAKILARLVAWGALAGAPGRLWAESQGPTESAPAAAASPACAPWGTVKFVDRQKAVIVYERAPEGLAVGNKIQAAHAAGPVAMTVILHKPGKKMLAAQFDGPPPADAAQALVGQAVALWEIVPVPAAAPTAASPANAPKPATPNADGRDAQATRCPPLAATASPATASAAAPGASPDSSASSGEGSSAKAAPATAAPASAPDARGALMGAKGKKAKAKGKKPARASRDEARANPLLATRVSFGQTNNGVIPVATGLDVLAANPWAGIDVSVHGPASWWNMLGLRVIHRQGLEGKVSVNDLGFGTTSTVAFTFTQQRVGPCGRWAALPWLAAEACVFALDRRQDVIKLGALRGADPSSLTVTTAGPSADFALAARWDGILALALRVQPPLTQRLTSRESSGAQASGEWTVTRIGLDAAYPMSAAGWGFDAGMSVASLTEKGSIKGDAPYTQSKGGLEGAAYVSVIIP